MVNQHELRGASARVAETTRYLCAAAYLDKRFADEVVLYVLQEEYRAVAPSYGVDIVPVICHCLAARRRRLLHDSILTSLVLGMLPLLFIPGVSLVGWAVLVLLLGCIVVFVAFWLDRRMLADNLLRDRFDADAAPAPTSPRDARLIRELEHDVQSNITVYSGFSPFVGSGIDNDGWSFTTNTKKGKETLHGVAEPIPFEPHELYDFVSTDLRELHIEGLHVENRLFINGRDIRDLSWILPDQFSRPLAAVDNAQVQHFLHAPTQRVRHYLVVQVLAWHGELVVSIFLRFTQVGATLFSEAAYFLLPPVREEYHEVDDMGPVPDAHAVIKLIAKAAVATPGLLVLSPVRVTQWMLSGPRRSLKRRSTLRRIRTSSTFDYGSAWSLRESGMSTEYSRYFQKLDREMYIKLTQQRILDLITEFLDKRNIDTSDLKERQSSIMNNGVIVSGGSIQAKNMAVGVGARARADQTLPTLGQMAPPPTVRS
jgi:hypothetical protein